MSTETTTPATTASEPPRTTLPSTPGQTIGPFYGYALPYPKDSELVPPRTPGAVLLHGVVFDGNGDPIPDALLEIWQADAEGNVPRVGGSLHRDGYTFTGFGRAAVDDEGHYRFSTVNPGPITSLTPGVPDSVPYFLVTVFARGLLNRLFTRIYLPENDPAASDPLLGSLSPAEQATLIATREADGSLRHDIRLQGDGETVFLDFD